MTVVLASRSRIAEEIEISLVVRLDSTTGCLREFLGRHAFRSNVETLLKRSLHADSVSDGREVLREPFESSYEVDHHGPVVVTQEIGLGPEVCDRLVARLAEMVEHELLERPDWLQLLGNSEVASMLSSACRQVRKGRGQTIEGLSCEAEAKHLRVAIGTVDEAIRLSWTVASHRVRIEESVRNRHSPGLWNVHEDRIVVVEHRHGPTLLRVAPAIASSCNRRLHPVPIGRTPLELSHKA